MSSKDQFAGLTVQEAAGSTLIESTADVLQNAVVRHDHHTLSPLPSHYLLHTRQSSHGSIEASLTVLQGGREDLVQNVQVSMSVLFFLRDVFDVLLVYKGVLPFGLV